MKSFLCVLTLLLTVVSASAQRVCGTTDYLRSQSFAASSQFQQETARDTVPNEIIIIPVVVHVIFNNEAQNISDAQVRSQIDVLNRDFRRLNADTSFTPAAFRSIAGDARIMFCLAQVDPAGRPTRGIVRRYTPKSYFLGDDGMKFSAAGGDDAWDSRKYLNIWVCNMFGRSLGYATPPGGQPDKDGVVINYDVFGTIGNLRSTFDKGRTTTHEVGHWLGLIHIWGDDICGDDLVDDTPPQEGNHYHCPDFPQISSCSINGSGDLFNNFMDFTDDACMNIFTKGQVKRMRALFSRNGNRNSFLNSFVCDSSLASGAPLPDDTLAVAKPAGNVKVYPNPAGPYCTIEPDGNYDLVGKTLTMYQSNGVRVFQKKMINAKEVILLQSLAPGIYWLTVGEGSERRTVRIIKL